MSYVIELAKFLGVLPVANGGTNSSTSLSNGKVMGSSGGKIVELANGQLPGTATNDNASAGNVGEYIESIVSSASAVAQTANETYTNITSISLTAGDWDIFGLVGITKGSSPTNVTKAAISAFTGNTTTDQTTGDNDMEGPIPTTNGDTNITIYWRRSIASTTTYFLKFKGDGGTSMTGYGKIGARRMR